MQLSPFCSKNIGLCRNNLILAILLLLAGVSFAENRTEQHIILELGMEEAHATIGLIHGWGFLSFENLTFGKLNPEEWSARTTPLQIDVVVSTLPEYDGRDHFEFTQGEDWEFWETLGIGASINDKFNLCCTSEAFENGSCSDPGRIIVSDTSEEKLQTSATILPEKTASDPLSKWASSSRFDYTTPAVLVIANCNASISENAEDFSGKIVVDGNLVWMSYTSTSSIPTKLILALLHLGVFCWYRYEMAKNWQSRIQIEVWIHGVLALAAASTVVTFAYTSLEAMRSREILCLRVASDFLSKTTHVVSRCLYVAIALGLGVTKTRLSMISSSAIVVLGLLVLGSKETADVMGDISFVRRDNNFGDDFNQQRHEFLKMQFKFNMLFVVWIPLALLWTMREMRTMEVEPQKLHRHLWLFRLYFLSWLVTSGMVSLYVVMRYSGRHGSISSIVFGNAVDRNAVDEICNFAYWITLLGMAILWKPNPEAPMYGYVLLSDGLSEESSNDKNDESSNDVSTMELAQFSPSSSEEVHHDLSLQVVETVEEPQQVV